MPPPEDEEVEAVLHRLLRQVRALLAEVEERWPEEDLDEGGVVPVLRTTAVLDPAFHERVREGYLRLAAAEQRRWVVINAARDEAAISQDVWREVDALLGAPA